MFETKKTLIVIYKDELLMNQLKKLIETRDDVEGSIKGTRDDSINVVSWTEKVWLGNKKAGNIQGKILFLGDVKGTDKLVPVIDVKFDECGIKFGWAGNQAVLFVEPKALTDRAGYDEFLKRLNELPVPEFLKTMKQDVVASESEIAENASDDEKSDIAEQQEHKAPAIFNVAKKVIKKGGNAISELNNKVAAKSEELFRNKNLMKRQMLFYGVVHLYNDGLENFMNQ